MLGVARCLPRGRHRGKVRALQNTWGPLVKDDSFHAYNGHYACTCYHPLFLFNQFSDLERCASRPGNVHSADGWDGVLKPVVMRYKKKVSRIYFRADGGFANPDVYEFLEDQIRDPIAGEPHPAREDWPPSDAPDRASA